MNAPTASAVDVVGAAIARELARNTRRPLIVGICGAQGSGKSTLSAQLCERLHAADQRGALLSLDDLYLPLDRRHKLAEEVHPLLHTRGVPGTHDVALGIEVLDALRGIAPVRLPAFDKATDDRRRADQWAEVTPPLDVVLFEGWCIGARPQTPEALRAAVNSLEAEEDGEGRWRHFVNSALAGDYQRLFAKIDYLVLLAAPSFEIVQRWRTQQEHELRDRVARSGSQGTAVMSDVAIVRFIQHYERLTRHILAEMPPRANLVVRLAEDRSVIT